MSSYSIFRVIKVIDEYSIVINGGLKDDVSIGDKIEIYLEGEVITDPFNNDEELGTLDFPKDTLEATEVYSNFSVCKKIVTREIHHPSALQRAINPSIIAGLSGFAGTTEIKKIEEKLNVDESEITGRTTTDKTIKIGDMARIALSN